MKKLPSFYVSIPIAGSVTFKVKATDRDAAIAAAWKAIDDGESGEETWEYFETLVEGNCLNAPTNEIEVTEDD